MSSVARSVTRLGGSPDSGCNQTFVRSTVENRMPLPSGVHSINPFAVAGAMVPSSRAGADPSSRIVTSISRFAPVATLIPARDRPSGDTAGRSTPGAIIVGSPPSIETRHVETADPASPTEAQIT